MSSQWSSLNWDMVKTIKKVNDEIEQIEFMKWWL